MRVSFFSLPVLLSGLAFAASAQTGADRTLSLKQASPTPTPLPHAAVTAPAPQLNRSVAPVRRRPSGAYTSDAMGPAILAKNADYETLFKITATVPAGSTISNVSWRYGLSATPAGFDAILCLNGRQRCWNVTGKASGSTSAFNGQDATQSFTLHYRVKGSGQLGPPARGAMNQLIVTYDLP